MVYLFSFINPEIYHHINISKISVVVPVYVLLFYMIFFIFKISPDFFQEKTLKDRTVQLPEVDENQYGLMAM